LSLPSGYTFASWRVDDGRIDRFTATVLHPFKISFNRQELTMKFKLLFLSLMALGLGLMSTHVQAGDDMADKDKKDIVDTAVAAGDFKTLAAALKAADLVDTLKGKGPFTVFAPTDEAFAKLPAGTVEMLLKPENKAKLVKILTYHVVPGKVTAAEVVKLNSAKTVEGDEVKITVTDGKVKVDDANVTKTDIECSNGVIHVIDTVLMPK
jgi:uncharacterized surface protein with fasciclin (FAS1) repeats